MQTFLHQSLNDGEFVLFTFCLLQIFRDYLTFAGIGLTNAQMFEMSVGEVKQNQVILGTNSEDILLLLFVELYECDN